MRNTNIKEKIDMIQLFILKIILAIAVACLISSIFTLVTNDFDRTKASFFGYQINYVKSGSMEPTIMTHQILFTKIADYDDIEIGDVITYRCNDEWCNEPIIIHRVIDKNDEYIRTKGDNNDYIDPWNVYPEDIIAKTVKDYAKDYRSEYVVYEINMD